MKKYRKTGKGLLGLIDRIKTPLICITASALILGAYSMACADDIEVRSMQPKTTIQYEPFQSEYTHEMDKLIEEECMRQGIDESLAIAISRLETGHYTSRLFTESNNFGGMGDGTRYYEYKTPADGARAFVEMVARYITNGYDTPKKMQRFYCPENENWAKMVEEIRSEL